MAEPRPFRSPLSISTGRKVSTGGAGGLNDRAKAVWLRRGILNGLAIVQGADGAARRPERRS